MRETTQFVRTESDFSRLGTIAIDTQLNGPRRFANGGFAAGTLARYVDADTVTVVLHRPIPLGRPLSVRDDVDGVSVRDGRRAYASARPGRLVEMPAPPAPSFEEAVHARAAYPLAGIRHTLSDCVVCSPDRRDGMHVTPGPVRARPEILAAPWVVTARHSIAGGTIYPAVWAALDCPSYPARALESRTLCLLGTMTARVERRPGVGERLVVFSWTRRVSGRRHETSAAIVDDGGNVIARADSTWIAVRRQGLARIIGRIV